MDASRISLGIARMTFALLPLTIPINAAAERLQSSAAVERPRVTSEVGAGAMGEGALTPNGYRIVVNIPERVLRVYQLPADAAITDLTAARYTFPVAIGTRRHRTPTLEGVIGAKRARPVWNAPDEEWARMSSTSCAFG